MAVTLNKLGLPSPTSPKYRCAVMVSGEAIPALLTGATKIEPPLPPGSICINATWDAMHEICTFIFAPPCKIPEGKHGTKECTECGEVRFSRVTQADPE